MGVRNWEFLKPWQVERALVQLFSSRCSLIFHQQRSPHIRGRFTYLGSHTVTRYRRKVAEPWVFCTQCWCRKYRREFFCRLAFGGEYTQILICDLFVDFRFVVLRYIQMCTTSLWLNNFAIWQNPGWQRQWKAWSYVPNWIDQNKSSKLNRFQC